MTHSSTFLRVAAPVFLSSIHSSIHEQTQRARGSRTNSSLSPSDDDVRQISGESKGAMCAPDEVSPRFFSVAELREIVNALMGLSRLSNRVPSTLATSSTFPRGLKLACALAITAIGVQRDTSPLDVPRKVGRIILDLPEEVIFVGLNDNASPGCSPP